MYLPAGAPWRDAWTGAEHHGGQWITAPAPLDTIPVYLRGGAIEPFASLPGMGSAL